MNPIFVMGLLCLFAYLLQGLFGFIQLKHFTREYSHLRKVGRVAIGRRAGKVKSGTIVMFALDKDGIILDSRKMQGTTVLAKFKPIPGFEGVNIETLNQDSELVKRENKLTQLTILDAVQTYQQVKEGKAIVEKPAPISQIGVEMKDMKNKIFKKHKKRSV